MNNQRHNRQEKRLFYAEIGHDLRQPLQAVKILLSLLKEDSQSLSQFELLSKIENSIIYLESGIDNLVATARTEGKKFKYHTKKISLDQILTPIAEEYKIISIYKNIELNYKGKML